MKVYVDGKYYDKEDAKISVFDHGLLYGDGVFEGIRAYKGKIFKCDEHIRRLYDSARAIWLTVPMSEEQMAVALHATLEVNKLKDAYIRLVVTRGKGDLGLDPRKCPKATVIIIADSIALYPEEFYEKGLEVITTATRRIPPDCLSPRVKSLNYLNNIMAKIEGIQAGCMEVIMLNRSGYVAECSADNIFMLRDGRLFTPPLEAGALGGITRNTVLELARGAGYETQEPNLTLYDLYTADEVFLTGTAAEVMPVVKIDGRVIADGKPGQATRDLRKRFMKLVGR
ncbi:MAG TPA: branched-chain-amino-acid transaminase [Planctomycetota bacterium]|nr:branched-chain-amino-acid transaminase [Planctomycetota bacterium]